MKLELDDLYCNICGKKFGKGKDKRIVDRAILHVKNEHKVMCGGNVGIVRAMCNVDDYTPLFDRPNTSNYQKRRYGYNLKR